jgi:hypothetical protein
MGHLSRKRRKKKTRRGMLRKNFPSRRIENENKKRDASEEGQNQNMTKLENSQE